MLNLLRKNDDLGHQTTIWMAPLGRIEDNPYQTRQRNDSDHVLNLAASIAQMARSLPDSKGLQQLPVGRLVRYGDGQVEPEETYGDDDLVRSLLAGGEHVVELAFGHSRRLAFLVLGRGVGHVFPELAGAEQVALGDVEYDAADYQAMPVLLRPLTDQEMWEHAITENAQRRDLTAIEEAIAIERARKDFGMTYDQAGRLFGKTRGAAANLVRLLQLPEEYQQAILDGRLTERHGRALLKLTPYPDAFAQWPVDQVADYNVNYLDKSLGFTVTQWEMRQAAKAKPQGRRLLADEAVKLVGTWIDEQWARDLPENPAHTNGTFWQELTRWMRENVDEIWYESDLKFAIKQVAAVRRQAAVEATPVAAVAAGYQRAVEPYHVPLATYTQVAMAFAHWLSESKPNYAALKELRERWTVAALWWPMLTALKAECNGAGISDRYLRQVLDLEISRLQSDLDGQTRSEPAAEQPPVVFDEDGLRAYLERLTDTIEVLGKWAAEYGHQAEAGAAARAVRAVVERIEQDLSG